MAKKRKRIKKKRKKQVIKTMYKKPDNKKQIASILVWIAIVFLLFNGIYALVVRESLVSEIDAQSMQELGSLGVTTELIETAIIYISVIWIVFAVLFFLAKTGIEKKKVGWGWLLALSILALFTGRIESAILGIVSSVLYAKSK
jgi:uncharacterized BrkB/YihY/UPF0761 family membrane protein